jgi:DeoR/GlpR family transcriptional regulator of sugar metabolism
LPKLLKTDKKVTNERLKMTKGASILKDIQEQQLLDILSSREFVKIEELANILDVSTSTVRRKLTELQNRGLVTRLHGGAQINDEKNYFPKFSFRSHINSFEKKKIALSAIKLIKNGDVIFLDGSTSAFYIGEYLAEFKNIKVFTNGIDTLSLLSKHGINAYSTGGRVSTENPSVLVGHYAENMTNSIKADICFFSAQAVTTSGEIYDCFEDEIALRRSMITNSTKSVFLFDSTKFGRSAPFHLCSLNNVDYMASTKDAPDYFDKPLTCKFISL